VQVFPNLEANHTVEPTLQIEWSREIVHLELFSATPELPAGCIYAIQAKHICNSRFFRSFHPSPSASTNVEQTFIGPETRNVLETGHGTFERVKPVMMFVVDVHLRELAPLTRLFSGS
jgi:hypothetical protein